jgi:multiple sugar transport system ATP-binding protein
VARSAVQFLDVHKTFAKTHVIDGVSLSVDPGEFVVFVGPSGCGKSTLLRLIAGLEAPDSGRIVIGERDVTDVHPAERGIAMVFQSYALYPHMSVAENMGFGLRIRGLAKDEIAARVGKAAEILQLGHLLERKPKALSGGQRQRVAIGRAIVREPEVFLFDEPLSNLDAALRGQMRIELARLHAQIGATMIYVTHDQVEAMTLASKIVVLNGGRVEQVGAPLDLYRKPANRFVAGFLGAPRMNFLPAHIVGGDNQSVTVDVGGTHIALPRTNIAGSAGSAATLGVRPEDFTLGSAGESFVHGEITLIERLGGEALAYVRSDASPDEPIVVKLAGDTPAARHEMVCLAVKPSACHLFDPEGRALGAPP